MIIFNADHAQIKITTCTHATKFDGWAQAHLGPPLATPLMTEGKPNWANIVRRVVTTDVELVELNRTSNHFEYASMMMRNI